nr:hypothetical protein CFP56_39602 [Quercus suber]
MSALSWAMSRVFDDPLIHNNHHGGMCCMVSGMVLDNSLDMLRSSSRSVSSGVKEGRVSDDRHSRVCHVMSRRVLDDPWVLDDPLIRDDRQSRMCHVVSRRVLDDPWVPDYPLIRDDRQSRMCHVVLGKIPDDLSIHDDHQGGICRMVSGKVPANPLESETVTEIMDGNHSGNLPERIKQEIHFFTVWLAVVGFSFSNLLILVGLMYQGSGAALFHEHNAIML